jgi:thioredoxin reductase (NADPH)
VQPEPAPTETPDAHGAHPRLSDAQIQALAERGERRPTRVGEVLYREGEALDDFIVVLAGLVAMVDDTSGDARPVAAHGPGRFLGELSLLTGQPAFLGAMVVQAGEVLVTPVDRLRALVAEDPPLGDLIVSSYLLRRSLLIELGAGLRIIGSRYSPDCRGLRQFMIRNRIPHRWIDLERDPEAETLLRRLGVTPEETPVVLLGGARVLRNPSPAELAAAVGLRHDATQQIDCDLLVVGAGPGGLAASVYGASEGLETVVVDAVAAGGQAATSSRIENYLGFPTGVSGGDLAERAVIQAERFGARLTVPARATALEERDGHHLLRFHDGTAVSARTVVIATGAEYRRLALPRLEEFEGISVHYAATPVEAQTCAGDPVAVVGGGNSAGQAAVFLARRAGSVTMVVRAPDLDESMSRYLVDRIERTPNIEVMRCCGARELVGDDGVLEAVVVENNETGARRTIPARALFVFIGAEPRVGWLADQLALDDKGFILTGADAADGTAPGHDGRRRMLETSRRGVFAVGDVRSGSIKRVASAVGEGAIAVRLVHDHLYDTAQSHDSSSAPAPRSVTSGAPSAEA